MGVVVKPYAPDPYRPQVRVVFGRDRRRLEIPYDLHLWDAPPGTETASSVAAPLDPAEYDIDPLALM